MSNLEKDNNCHLNRCRPQKDDHGHPSIADCRGEELPSKKQKIESSSREGNHPLSEEMGNVVEESQSQRQQQQQQQQQKLQQGKKKIDQQQQGQKRKRKICPRCHRPFPQTCLCDSLPETPIVLETAEVVVLQHPLELKNHKAASHRSLPLLELCLDPKSLVLRTGRRFGPDSLGTEILQKLWGETTADDDKQDAACACSYLPVLVFPKIPVAAAVATNERGTAAESPSNRNSNDYGSNEPPRKERYREDESTILSLKELVERWKAETTTPTRSIETKTTTALPGNVGEVSELPATTKSKSKKILLLVLDATWKHAREMHMANLKADQYPPHMLRLALQAQDFDGGFRSGRFRLRGKASKTGYKTSQTKRCKRQNGEEEAPLPLDDETWMSTAECIAWILSILESSSGSTRRGVCGGGSKNSESANHGNAETTETSKTPTLTAIANESPVSSSSSLYEILMKPLDAMVAKWNSYRNNNDSSSSSSSNNNNNKDSLTMA